MHPRRYNSIEYAMGVDHYRRVKCQCLPYDLDPPGGVDSLQVEGQEELLQDTPPDRPRYTTYSVV